MTAPDCAPLILTERILDLNVEVKGSKNCPVFRLRLLRWHGGTFRLFDYRVGSYSALLHHLYRDGWEVRE